MGRHPIVIKSCAFPILVPKIQVLGHMKHKIGRILLGILCGIGFACSPHVFITLFQMSDNKSLACASQAIGIALMVFSPIMLLMAAWAIPHYIVKFLKKENVLSKWDTIFLVCGILIIVIGLTEITMPCVYDSPYQKRYVSF